MAERTVENITRQRDLRGLPHGDFIQEHWIVTLSKPNVQWFISPKDTQDNYESFAQADYRKIGGRLRLTTENGPPRQDIVIFDAEVSVGIEKEGEHANIPFATFGNGVETVTIWQDGSYDFRVEL